MTKYTYDDIPNILNSISWNLKRIADSLEENKSSTDNKSLNETAKTNIKEMLAKLK